MKKPVIEIHFNGGDRSKSPKKENEIIKTKMPKTTRNKK
jgi:hypothetical protein